MLVPLRVKKFLFLKTLSKLPIRKLHVSFLPMKFFVLPRAIFSVFLFVAIQTFFGVAPGSAYVGIVSSPVTGLMNPTDPLNSNDDFFLYFEGPDHGLYKIACDNGELNPLRWDKVNDRTATVATRLGGIDVVTYSSPCVLHDYKNPNSWENATQGHIFFRGAGNELYRMNLDGTGLLDLGVQTLSIPCAIWEAVYKNGASTPLSESVYFQGLNNELFKVNSDGTGLIDLGVQTFSSPCAVNVKDVKVQSATTEVFYQGAGNELNKLDVLKFTTDPTHCITFLNNYIASTPALEYSGPAFNAETDTGTSEFNILFQSTENEFCKVDPNGKNPTIHTNQVILSSPYARSQWLEGGDLYQGCIFQGGNNNLITQFSDSYPRDDSFAGGDFEGCDYQTKSTPCSIIRHEASSGLFYPTYSDIMYICSQNSDDRLEIFSTDIDPSL